MVIDFSLSVGFAWVQYRKRNRVMWLEIVLEETKKMVAELGAQGRWGEAEHVVPDAQKLLKKRGG